MKQQYSAYKTGLRRAIEGTQIIKKRSALNSVKHFPIAVYFPTQPMRVTERNHCTVHSTVFSEKIGMVV